jgi:hypothetical protein
MTQQPIQISYRFDYFQQPDVIQFSIQVGMSPVIQIGLPADAFFSLLEQIIGTGQPFLETIKQRRAGGIKGDIKVEFDQAQWDKMMEEKNGG